MEKHGIIPKIPREYHGILLKSTMVNHGKPWNLVGKNVQEPWVDSTHAHGENGDTNQNVASLRITLSRNPGQGWNNTTQDNRVEHEENQDVSHQPE